MALLPANYLLPLIGTVVVVRVLGPERYSLLATLAAVTSTVTLYADMGVSKSIPKFEPEIKARWGEIGLRNMLGTLIFLRLLIFSAVVGGIYVFSEPFFTFFKIHHNQGLYLFLIAIMLLVGAPIGILRGLLIARFRNKELNLIQLFLTGGTPLLAIVAAVAGLGVPGILGSRAVVSVVQLILLGWATGPLLAWRGFRFFAFHKLDAEWRKRLAAFSGLTYFTLIIRYFTDLPFAILVMNIFGLHEQVAFLSIAYRSVIMVRNLATLPLSYTLGALLGNTSLDQTHQKLRRSYQTMARLYLLGVVPASLGLVFVGKPALIFLYGAEFVPALHTLQALAMFMATGTVISLGTSILQMYERYRDFLLTGALCIFTTVGSCFLLARQLGHTGVGIALGTGFLVWHGSTTWLAHRRYALNYPVDFARRVIIACLPMQIYWLFWGDIQSNWIFFIGYVIFSMIAFLGVLKLEGGVGESERTLVEQSRLPLKNLILRLI